ncbi:MAG: hypothetical protein ACW968_02025 [Candidatus Thorarchaeota archaeon]|jgi:hypothetical protein
MMRKIDEIIPELGFFPALIIVIVLGIALELSGVWMTMIIAGTLGALFVRRHRHAFLAGFLGVAISWTVLFLVLTMTSQASVIAEFFIGLLGITGLGWLVMVISILVGALLGAFGGLLGRSVYELIDELIGGESTSQAPQTDE